jgi:hypothetical protein
MPLTSWLYLRLLVPTAPIIIQYGLSKLDLYQPAFPQLTYILLLFSLSAVTLTEYTDFKKVFYLSVLPSWVAIILYLCYLLRPEDQAAQYKILITGFYAWLSLLIVHLLRVLIERVTAWTHKPSK